MSNLADLIIEHGPYEPGNVVLASFASELLHVGGLNALREELIELRRLRAQAEALGRYTVDIDFWNDEAHMACMECRIAMSISADGTLAELNQRADEHTEVCQ